jgi:hypothetical protein
MKRISLLMMLILLFTSCTQRGCQSTKRDFQTSNRIYDITVYSGGKVFYHDKIKGIVNQEDSTDGIYYFKGDTLIELSGQYCIKSLDK